MTWSSKLVCARPVRSLDSSTRIPATSAIYPVLTKPLIVDAEVAAGLASTKAVVVDLTTHDAGGITELDFTLAAHMDASARD